MAAFRFRPQYPAVTFCLTPKTVSSKLCTQESKFLSPHLKGTPGGETEGQEPALLLGRKGGGDIAQDTGRTPGDEWPGAGYAVERGAALVRENHYTLME